MFLSKKKLIYSKKTKNFSHKNGFNLKYLKPKCSSYKIVANCSGGIL